MEFGELVRNRRSIRQYEPRPVPEELIQELLEMIRFSVSAMNMQPWKIKVVSDPETKEKAFAASFGQQQVRTCSHLLVLCADVDCEAIIKSAEKNLLAAGWPEERVKGMMQMASDLLLNRMTPEQRLQWAREQVHIALGNAVNGAYALGLGACPMTAFDPEAMRKALELPETVIPTALVSVGYPAEPGVPKVRRPLSEILI